MNNLKQWYIRVKVVYNKISIPVIESHLRKTKILKNLSKKGVRTN